MTWLLDFIGTTWLGRQIERFVVWLGKFAVDGRTGEPSAKRVGLLMAVTSLTIVMALWGGVVAGIAWCARMDPQRVEILRVVTSSIEVIAGLVLTAVTTGYLVGNHLARKSPPAEQGPPAGSP